MSNSKVTVGYWDCRGLAHPIILLLEFLKKPYELINPSKELVGPPPKYAKTKWLEAKDELLKGFDFPNLPYYYDPDLDVKLTQTNAILMHIARTNDLCPNPTQVNEKTMTEMDMLREELKDFYLMTTGLTYNSNVSNELIEEYVKTAKTKLDLLEKKLGSQWFLGKILTYLDFMAYDIIDHQRILFPTILQEFVKIKAFMDTFEELQGIKDFMKSDRYKKFPLWSERSFFGRNADNLPTISIAMQRSDCIKKIEPQLLNHSGQWGRSD